MWLALAACAPDPGSATASPPSAPVPSAPPVAAPPTAPVTAPVATPTGTTPGGPLAAPAFPPAVADPDLYDVAVGLPDLALSLAAATVATDGAIWLAVHDTPADSDIDGTSYGIGLVRLGPDGALDASLGIGGLVETGLLGGPVRLAPARDGGVLLAAANLFGEPGAAVERRDRYGIVDPAFAPPIDAPSDRLAGLVAADDGGAFVLGAGLEVTRLLPDGAPDPGYSGGWVVVAEASALVDAALLDDGTLRLDGAEVHALGVDGAPDPAFGPVSGDGRVAFSPDGGMARVWLGEITLLDPLGAPIAGPLALPGGGAFVVPDHVGGYYVANDRELRRVDPAGALDGAFGAVDVGPIGALLSTERRAIAIARAGDGLRVVVRAR